MAALNITKDNFISEVLESDKPVLIDFWASWCGPCKMVSPVIEEISEEVSDIKICKVNVDEEKELAIKYQVMSIPTLLIIKDGSVVHTSVGAKNKSAIMKLLEEYGR